MKSTVLRATLLVLFIVNGTLLKGQYYGMQFSGLEVSLDKRSGLDLTPDRALPFNGNIELKFHLSFEPGFENNFGYIFRLILGENNIDLIHGTFRGNPNNFELVVGDRTSKIAFQIPAEELSKDWITLAFNFDFRNHRVTCLVNDLELEDQLDGFDREKNFRLMFGAHNYGNFASTDVPNMIIRDVEVKSGNKVLSTWPLNETQGTLAHSVPGGKNGVALNPGWLLPHLNTWNQVLEMEISGRVKTTYDSRSDELYIVSKDSIHIFSPALKSVRSIAQSSRAYLESDNEILFDTASGQLLMYSLDDNYLTSFNVESGGWEAFLPTPDTLTQFWHHNSLMLPDGTIYGFGGYGWHMYKNSVYAWNPVENRFDSIAFKGEFFPRYLAGAGYNPSDGQLYLIGGFGSESGRQSESPDYYYEILRFAPGDAAFTRIFEFSGTEVGFCFANSVVFDDSGNMYALSFPKFQFENKLQLVKIPLAQPEVIELGDVIPYNFLDIRSFADLHYIRSTNELLAVTLYRAEERTSVAVHTIGFPPQPNSTEFAASTEGNRRLYLYLGGGLILLFASFLMVRRRGKTGDQPVIKPSVVQREVNQGTQANSIILFGGFQVIDRMGQDITGQFTPLPKRLLLFILLHSLRNNKGISSNTLYETFWFDKSVESARNNRAVNIVKLKSLLENVETTAISKETGYWKFNFDPSRVHIDYFHFLQIVRHTKKPTRDHMVDLLSIVENRPFLNNTDAEWLDPFKSEVSNELIDTLLNYIRTSDDDPEFLLHLANCIFVFDSVSEEALRVKCRLLIKQGKHSLAKNTYTKFSGEYKLLYDEEFGLSFNQVIADQP